MGDKFMSMMKNIFTGKKAEPTIEPPSSAPRVDFYLLRKLTLELFQDRQK